MTRFPAPDRSTYLPNRVKTEENPQLDIGWAEGTLSDGRPFRVEAWCEDQVTSLTVFFSRVGLESLTREEAADLLEREGLVRYLTERRSAYPVPIEDDAGNAMWSVNVVVGMDGDPPVAEDRLTLRAYAPGLGKR